jgi:LEA14-like dessication related protein
VGLQGGTLDVILDVYNPNDYRIDARKISYTVFVDSAQIASGEIERLVNLTNLGHSEIIVPVDFTFAAVQGAMQKFAQRGVLDYRVTGAFTMVTPIGSITRPYSGTGRLDSFRF